MVPRQSPGKGQRWLSLLRRITASCPTAVIWKNADAGIHGLGDVDLSASASDWAEVEALYLEWSAENQLGPVIVCRHLPSTMLLIALEDETPEILELDVKSRVTFKGSTVFRSDQLLSLAETDDRGFRKLRPGAEGLLKLIIKGGTRSGRPREVALARERVRELIDEDPAGAEAAGALFRRAAPTVAALSAASARGEWDRRAMLAIEARAGLRALREPSVLYGQLRSLSAAKRCPVIGAVAGGRRIPGDRSLWLRNVGKNHFVNDIRSIR